MPRKKLGRRWLHHCRGRELVMQADRCADCGRLRTSQAEQRYANFARDNNVKV